VKRARKIAAIEWLGIAVLALMAAWFLWQSWCKWADPIIDSGPQWYADWRVSLGAVPYRDFNWNYGPISILFDGLLFKIFGPGMMVLAAANLVIYAGIVTLAYIAFRTAWGRLAAFAALAVFVSVFSFSMINSVGNYNYVLPYANETTRGVLLMTITVFAFVQWCGQPSGKSAFWLGLCGGVASVLKPEFMLAWGVLATGALLVRFRQRQRPSLGEFGVMAAGLALPTLLFTLWFWRFDSLKSAFADACQAWWVVLVSQRDVQLVYQDNYTGIDHAWRNIRLELLATFGAALVVGAIWAAGWFVNRPWRPLVRWLLGAAALYLACSIDLGGGFEIGLCFPGLMLIIFIVVMTDLARDPRIDGRIGTKNLMALALVLLAGALLARMFLRSRINHFGFIQAAFAGMTAAAVIVAKVPKWTGHGLWGRRVALGGIVVMLGLCCRLVVAESMSNHAMQTQPIGSGADRFYAFKSQVDETGAIVNWTVEQMKSAPPDATLLVLPEGVMINYLSRHVRPMREYLTDEDAYIKQLSQVRPDYVIIIWGDQRDAGISQFGDPGHEGARIAQWLRDNYTMEKANRGKSKWAFMFHQKPASLKPN
jgi:hypothetical protein